VLASIVFIEESIMTWETPTATEWRFGFEITMYIANR
jgi:coenzyme PQQ precursor peptide PqqA